MSLNSHNRLNIALSAFAYEYFKNRYKYLYEVDVQVLLSEVLEKHFNEPHFIIRQQKKGEGIGITEFDIGKIHREYPAKVLFDNVVLGKPKQLDEVNSVLPFDIGFESFYHQPIKYAIELKFVPLYQGGVSNTDNSWNDYVRMASKLVHDELYFQEEVEYAIQLTLFQGLKEQQEFLNNHNGKFIE